MVLTITFSHFLRECGKRHGKSEDGDGKSEYMDGMRTENEQHTIGERAYCVWQKGGRGDAYWRELWRGGMKNILKNRLIAYIIKAFFFLKSKKFTLDENEGKLYNNLMVSAPNIDISAF